LGVRLSVCLYLSAGPNLCPTERTQLPTVVKSPKYSGTSDATSKIAPMLAIEHKDVSLRVLNLVVYINHVTSL